MKHRWFFRRGPFRVFLSVVQRSYRAYFLHCRRVERGVTLHGQFGWRDVFLVLRVTE